VTGSWLHGCVRRSAPVEHRLRRSYSVFIACLFILSGGILLAQQVAPDDGKAAAGVVETLHEQLLASMRAGSQWDFAERYRQLEAPVTDSYDLPLVSRAILGRVQWKEIDEAARQRFVEVFTRLTVATYADRFDHESGVTFATRVTEPQAKGRMLVKTELTTGAGEVIPLHYLLARDRDGAWRIITVIAQGVNDLALKRSEYGSIIQAQGFDGLIGELRQQIAKFYPDTPGADG